MTLLFLFTSNATATGPGIRSGNVVIHPKVIVSAGYDSNFWRESTAEATSPVNPVTVIKFGGGIHKAAIQVGSGWGSIWMSSGAT